MVDKKISDLTALTGAQVATGDEFEILDVSDSTFAATGTNKRITVAEIVTALGLNGLDSAGLKKASVHLSASDLLTLNSVPITAIAAQGSGRAILAMPGGIVEFKAGLTRYNGWNAMFAGPAGMDSTEAAITCDVGGITPSFFATLGTHIMGAWTSAPVSAGLAAADYDNQPLLIYTADPPVLAGAIITAAIGNAGSGYAHNDTGTITDSQAIGASATYRVDTVGGGGAVTAFTITAGGDPNYQAGDTLGTTATSGGGSGFTVTVSTIPAADGDLYVTVYYTVETLH